MSRDKIKPVHLVGSVSLQSASAVFESIGAHLGDCVARIPDGETGERRTPFPMREALIAQIKGTPGVVFLRDWHLVGMTLPLYGLRPGTDPSDVEFGPLGFASAAIASYQDFERVRAAGKIGAQTRMQVCLPTPFMLEFCFTAPEHLLALQPAYERAMRRELAEILKVVPADRLAIQWDNAPEITEVLERRNPEVAEVVSRGMLVAAVARITDAVPAAVEVGWHFCYGDSGQYAEDHETFHAIEPRDLGVMVDFANDVCATTSRSVQWVHMPVPRERDDAAYFAPLERLKLKPGMQLFLGLVHKFDGLEGAKRRVAAAKEFYPEFGVGTECGMGRRPPEVIPALLDLHAAIAGVL
jgi:methionine synthase II (cobalamin-independent)